MDTATVVDLGRYALWMTALISAPLLVVALGVGLVIGILQAATSINEMTLSFVPKLVIVVMTFGLLSTFMLTQLSDYFAFIFDQITRIG